MFPTTVDIMLAIAQAETGTYLDPCDEPDPTDNWMAVAFDETGQRVSDGNAHSPGLAMGLAWLNAWRPDALIDAHVPDPELLFRVPRTWRFELYAPGKRPAWLRGWRG